MLQMKIITFPLGWLDLHHSESVLGLQPGEVGSAFSPLRTYRWKCYYNEEARTIISVLSNESKPDPLGLAPGLLLLLVLVHFLSTLSICLQRD